MDEEKSSYRQIMKATSIFGGVQVFQIIIMIIRSKFIAVLLGPTGMGIAGLFTSTLNLIASFINLGLGTSAVKNVSIAYSSGDTTRISIIIIVLKRLVLIFGIIGALFTLILSKWLSVITFGNEDYTIAFAWISLAVLFKNITTGQLVILQGLRKIKYLAKANLFGSFLGLVITIPLYYFYGLDAIVPGVIITALLGFLLSWYFSGKIGIIKVKVSKKRTLEESKDMLSMGVMLSLSGLMVMTSAYIVRVFISTTGTLSDVGLYNAGFAIINTYVGLIFTAMATDYYPRLSSVAHNNKLCKATINNQVELSFLIIAPIIIVFIVFIDWVIMFMYSTKFEGIDEMVRWAAIAMLFKIISWAIAFILLAKGASKLFLINEIFANIYNLVLSLLGYYYGGLTGLGIAFLIGYIVYLIHVIILTKRKYDFTFSNKFKEIFLVQFSLALCCFILIKILDKDSLYSYFGGVLFIIISSWYSYKKMDELIGLKEILISIKDKINIRRE